MIRQILIAGVFVFLAANAQAASFDCRKAETESEKVVCSNPLLSKLDGEMAAKYRAAFKALSAQGAYALQQSQSQFLQAAQYCPESPSIDMCLWSLYSSRIEDLDIESRRVGPYHFIRLMKYAFSVEGGGSAVGANSLRLYRTPYPQIDRPVASSLGAWNAMSDGRTAVSGVCDSGGGEASADYRIKQATGRLIIVEYSEDFYCPGAPHGFGTVKTEAYVVKPKLRPLEAEDFFFKGDEWQKLLTDTCVASVEEALNADQVERIRLQMENPAKWVPRRNGLEVSFTLDPPDTERQHLNTAFVPWEKLKPYLRPDAPIPK